MDTETIHTIGEWMVLAPACIGIGIIVVFLIGCVVCMIIETWKDSKWAVLSIIALIAWLSLGSFLRGY